LVVVRNNIAVFGWLFMSVWMGFLVLITYIFVRDGGFHQFNPLAETGVMLMFWVFGLGGCGELFGHARVRVTVDAGGVLVEERYFLRRRTARVRAADVVLSEVRETKDSEGDPYFVCALTLPSGRSVTVAESNDRQTVEATRQRLAAALG